MLPRYYKIRVYNDAGVSVTIQIDFNPYKITSGSPVYAGNLTMIASGALASATATSSTATDNTASSGNIGGHLTVFATPSLSPSGNKQLLIYLIGSNDNTTFEDIQAGLDAVSAGSGEGLGTLIGVMPVAGTNALHQQFEI